MPPLSHRTGFVLLLAAFALSAPRALAQDVAQDVPHDAAVEAAADVPPDVEPSVEPELAPEDESVVVETVTAEETAEEAAADAPELEGSDAEAQPAAATTAAPASGPQLTLYGFVHGEWQFRFDGLTDLPLSPLPREPGTDALGQNLWASQWIRLRGELGLRPYLKLVARFDLLSGVLFGDTAVGIAPSAWRRDRLIGFGGDASCATEASCERSYPGIELRTLYLEWVTRAGALRIGQQAFSWGLGIVANDGDHRPVFGDYHLGDLVERVGYGLKPLGPRHPFTIAAAADLIYDDGTFDLRQGDAMYQGTLSAYWQEEPPSAAALGTSPVHRERMLGAFVAYRNGVDRGDDVLKIGIVDVFARWDIPEVSGGRLFAAFEGAYIFGTTSLARTIYRDRERVAQLQWAAQLGRTNAHLDIVFEAGYSSGDSNTEDGVQRRATMDGDHRVGLILFPEVMNWMTARAVASATSALIAGRPARGADLVPTNGGVAGAMYLFPYIVWRPKAWIEARLGAVVARTTSPNVDVVGQRLYSLTRNWRGGDPAFRDLGLELDAAVLLSTELRDAVTLTGGLEGGVFFPGQAFADADGAVMQDIGLVRARVGLKW
jgi:hypothetical protein